MAQNIIDGTFRNLSHVIGHDIDGYGGRMPRGALGALTLARWRLIDMVGIGDSNALFGGHGFDHGFGKAIVNRFGMYATPLYPGDTAGGRDNMGYRCSSALITSGAHSGAPAELEQYGLPANGINTYLAYRYQSADPIGAGLGTIASDGGLDVTANLRAYFCDGTFDSGSGSYRPAMRLAVAPYSTLVQGSILPTNTGAFGKRVTTLDVAANAGRAGMSIQAVWQLPSGTASVAPTIEFWSRIQNMDMASGASFSTLYGSGGYSLYDMAAPLLAASDASLFEYFDAVRYLQVQAGLDPIVVVYINSGLNDRGETASPSLGPVPQSDADGPAAYVDNLRAIVQRIEGVWDDAGWDRAGLFFLVIPSHPVSDPDDAELVTYVAAAQRWAVGRADTSVVDLRKLITAAQMTAGGYYDVSGHEHLTQIGYEALAEKILALA